ncbi:MAG TPA: peptide ABC transporter substrate-binding protein, partial [Gemmatimonadales bacterium]|nr:peptide ABC transporter substrate-binding protein [Gemmatimonadales bacterium]
MRRLPLLVALVPFTAPLSAARAQTAPDEGTLVIAVAREAESPVPTLWQNDGANRELSDLLFLRLADLGPDVSLTNEASYQPRLARHWERRDSLTLVFDLDPRARWQDGAPVTAADVIFAFDRARDPVLTPQLAPLLERIESVRAEGDSRVVFRFRQAYPEQMYDATFQVPPLPAHLLRGIRPESLATSRFIQQPVGDGPYRFLRRVPGQSVELAANDGFFLGRPRIRRVLFLLAGDPEARVNLLLSGQADAVDNIYALPNFARLEHLPAFQYHPVPGLFLAYVTMNLRDPADTSRPHPILADPVVRRALVVALDRRAIAHAAYGEFVQTPSAPVSTLLSRAVDAPPPIPVDTALARRLLASRGWLDHDHDGVLDKDGRPLQLSLLVPAVVNSRRLMAEQIQEAYRRLGITLKVDLLDANVYLERRDAGQFDLEFYGVGQDPSPTGLVQSWSCAGMGAANVGHYCDPAVDSLIRIAALARADAAARWGVVLRRIADDYPAIFMAATVTLAAVHHRFEHVVISPLSTWSEVWRWS